MHILSGQNIVIMKHVNLKYYAQEDKLPLWDVMSGAFTIAHTWHVPRGLSNFYSQGSQANFETPRK